jgi:FkbM family methyltransferase
MPEKYNPYTPENLEMWHDAVTIHIGWIIRHIGDYFVENNYDSIKMIDVGCCTGRLVQVMNEKIPVSDAILVDAIPEFIDYAKNLFGNKYNYEACVLGNRDEETIVTLPEYTDGKINLGGATARKVGINCRTDIPKKRFDTLWKEKYLNFEPDLIKIDAEGLDIDVMEGMKEFVSHLRKKPMIVYEIAGLNMSEDEVKTVYNRLSFLTDMGYKPLWEDSLAPKKCCDLAIVV